MTAIPKAGAPGGTRKGFGEGPARVPLRTIGCVGEREYSLVGTPELLSRLLARAVLDAAGCWVWSGALSGSGYGRISIGGRLYMVHRVMYVILFGPLDGTADVDHLCRNRRCCNPKHLEAVSRSVNLRRGLPGKFQHVGSGS